MSHPFFEALAYPWAHEPEAKTMHRVLHEAIPNQKDIERIYATCGTDLKPLTPDAADKMWQQALQQLTAAGRLRKLCYNLYQETQYSQNQSFRDAIRAVIEVASSESTTQHTTSDSQPFRVTARLVGLLLIPTAVGFAIGWIWHSAPQGRADPPATNNNPPATEPAVAQKPPDPPAPPQMSIFDSADRNVRSKLTSAELTVMEQNVDAASMTTVMVVVIGPWTANSKANIRVKPAEYASDKQAVYQKSNAVLKGEHRSNSAEVTWDADGTMTVQNVDGQKGDSLYVFVVLPITKASEALLSDPRTMKRFLCVEVSP